MPNNDLRMIGNVSFRSADVKDVKEKVVDGKKINCVFLNNNMSLEFPTQDAKNKSEVTTQYPSDMNYYNSNAQVINLNGLSGANIAGTSKMDIITLNGCNHSLVDGAHGADVIRFSDRTIEDNGRKIIQKSGDNTNEIKLDSEDTVEIKSRKDGSWYQFDNRIGVERAREVFYRAAAEE